MPRHRRAGQQRQEFERLTVLESGVLVGQLVVGSPGSAQRGLQRRLGAAQRGCLRPA